MVNEVTFAVLKRCSDRQAGNSVALNVAERHRRITKLSCRVFP